MSTNQFDSEAAFSRNIGWLLPEEAEVLKTKRVAIAGVGGVGGHYCEVLARLGICKFHIADPDSFEIVNFNRQNAAGISSLGKAKVDVIRDRILDINPQAEVLVFREGVTALNTNAFLKGVDLYLDGLDFFVMNERLELFRALRNKKIPAITVAPVGMGAALMVFDHKSMSMDEYFGIKAEHSIVEKSLRFLVGLTPTLIQRKYQVERSRVNFSMKKVPSTPMGCYLCAGVAATTALKILLQRGPIFRAPWSLHFDAYTQSYKKRYVWLGARNPLQILKRLIARKMTTGQWTEKALISESAEQKDLDEAPSRG